MSLAGSLLVVANSYNEIYNTVRDYQMQSAF